MTKYVIAACVLSVFLVGRAWANPDSVVVGSGDIHITGAGNSLVFADGSVQQSAVASSLVTQTVSATAGVSFPNGQMSGAQQSCVSCPDGMAAFGGGGKQTDGIGFLIMNGSYPNPDGATWCVFWIASLQIAQSGTVQTWANCVKKSLLTSP